MRLGYADSYGYDYTFDFNEMLLGGKEQPYVAVWRLARKDCPYPGMPTRQGVFLIDGQKVKWTSDIKWLSSEAIDYLERVVRLMVFT